LTRWRVLVLVGLLAALGVLPVLLFTAAEDSYGVYTPVGYVETVERMIDEGLLSYDCASDRILVADQLAPEDDFFYRNSYLAQDVAAWNGGDERPFFVEREQLAAGGCSGRLQRANASHHRQRLPSWAGSGWRGRLFMHQEGSGATLQSAVRTLEVVRPPLDLLPMDVSRAEDLTVVAGRPADARSPRLALETAQASRSFAALETIGDAATIDLFSSRPEVILNGCPVPQGERLRLDSGDALRLVSRSGGLDERFLVDSGERAGLLSFVSTVNGEERRQTVARRLPFAGQLVAAIDTAVVSGAQRTRGGGGEDASAPAAETFDVHLTVDAFSNDLLTRRLEEFARGRYGRRPLRAAVTLLDAESGRVQALASYPTPSSLDRLELRRAGDREALGLNHNFLMHPVGSTAKPFLAAAALATRPDLASLELRCFPGGTAPPELLGFPLGRYNLPGDCAASGEDGTVDLIDFLTVSSNRYMLYLGLLSMADWEGPAPRADRGAPEDRRTLTQLDRYRVSGTVQSERPRLPIVKAETADATELGDVADQQFFRELRALFDLSYQYRAGGSADRLERELWQPVLDRVPGIENDPDALLSFWPVTPEQVNVGANLVQDFRRDLYTLLLGLGDNRWSNLQMARAMGRLMTGDWDLQAHLVEEVSVPASGDGEPNVLYRMPEVGGQGPAGAPASRQAQPGSLSEVNRVRLLRGMAGAVESEVGTARRLEDPLTQINEQAPPGVAYRLFAKTGTPTTDPEILERSGTTPAPAALVNYPGGVQVQSGMLVLGIERRGPGVSPDRRVLVVYIEGQGGSLEAVNLAGEILRPLIEGTWPQDWLSESR
jgi:hypothetical protein